MNILIRAAAGAAALFAAGGAFAANIVTNGSFEQVDPTTGRFVGWTINPSANRPWGVGGTNVPGAGMYTASTGCVGAACATFGNAFANTLHQDLATVVGQDYALTFSYIFGGSAQGEQIINAYAGEVLVASLDYRSNFSNQIQSFSGSFVATSSTTRLTFLGRDDPSGLAIDLVSVSPGAVPEPVSWAMLVGGLGLAGGTLRRRGRVRFAA